MSYKEPSDYYRNSGQQRRRSSKPATPGIEQQAVDALLRGLGWLIMLPINALLKKGKSGQKRQLLSAVVARDLAGHWEAVQSKAHNPSTRDLAIAEADKLLDAALKHLDVSGATMGDRLKAAQALFPDSLYNRIWEAHKLRNRLAHEVGVQISPADAAAAIQTFQWALRELGVFV